MEDIILKIREQYNWLSKGEKRISDFILADPGRCLPMTSGEIAKESQVSSATVIRYAQKLGFEGIEGLKLALAASSTEANEWKMADPIISATDSLEDICKKMSVMLDAVFKDLFYQLDLEALKEAIQLVRSARRIYLLGIGASILPAYNLFHNLRRANLDANFYFDLNMLVEFFNYIDNQDVVIAFSYSGQSKEILYPCGVANKKKARVIAVTRNHESSLRKLADICLCVPDREEPMRIGPFTSVHTSVAIADLLYLGVIQEHFEDIEFELVKTRKLVEGLKKKY